MKKKHLEHFYEEWGQKTPEQIACDIASAERKSDDFLKFIPQHILQTFSSILDFGCGYGAVLSRLQERLPSFRFGLGVDFSPMGIKEAKKKENRQNGLVFEKLPYLSIADSKGFLTQTIKEHQQDQKMDVILLVDLLEHVPDCETLIDTLGPLTQTFLIKLPIENSILDNYVLKKEYPNPKHSNGHLREFTANNVYYFIRQLGLNPKFEILYTYTMADNFPPPPKQIRISQRMKRYLLMSFKYMMLWLLPKKIFLRLIGGGGYICVATYDPSHRLKPF